MTKFIPSPQQAQAITHRGGHLRIVACAGSGKTESLARRIASLVQEGVEPSEIVAFTFTEKAAAAKKWVEAVNNHGRLGRWAFDIARSEVELEEKLKAFLDTSDGKAVA